MGDWEEVDLTVEVEAAWADFRERLADELDGLDEEDFIVIQVETGVDPEDRDGAAPYVQFCGWGGGHVRAEAVSDHYLDDRFALGSAGEAQLLGLGWEPPEDDDGPDELNYFLDSHLGDVERLAAIAVRTLREVHGCPHPAFLSSGQFECVVDRPAVDVDAAIAASRAAEIPAIHPESVPQLQALVDAALEAMFDGPAEHDADGDIPISCGLSRAFVRVSGELPAVDVFAHLVVDIEETDEVVAAVNRHNADSAARQLSVVDGMVLARTRVIALPFVPGQLRVAVDLFCHDLDEVAESLAAEVGGRRFLEPPAPPRGPLPPRPRPTTSDLSVDPLDPDGLSLAALLEVLHEDDDLEAAEVAALVGEDRTAIVRHLVAIRTGQVDVDGHDRELVLGHLRRALRHLARRQARLEPGPGRRRRELTHQLTLLPDDDSLDGGSWDVDLA